MTFRPKYIACPTCGGDFFRSEPWHRKRRTTRRGWLVHYPDGRTVEAYILSADGSLPTRAEVLAVYSSAIGATPISERETHA